MRVTGPSCRSARAAASSAPISSPERRAFAASGDVPRRSDSARIEKRRLASASGLSATRCVLSLRFYLVAHVTGAKLEHHRAQLLREERMGGGHFLADAGEGRFEPQSSFDADQHQVERVGKGVDDFLLTALGANANQQRRHVKPRKRRGHQHEI